MTTEAICEDLRVRGINPMPYVGIIDFLLYQVRALRTKADEQKLSSVGRGNLYVAVMHGVWAVFHRRPWKGGV